MKQCPMTGHPDFNTGSFHATLFRVTGRLQREMLKLHLEYKFGELTALHMGVLGTLSRYQPLSSGELAEKLEISRPQMTALLEKLESRGLVRRTPAGDDRRRIEVSLTPEGKSTLDDAMRQQENQMSTKLGNLDAADLAALQEALLALDGLLDKLQNSRLEMAGKGEAHE